MSERKSPVDHAIDLAVYAPIGLVSEARRLFPSFVDKGRARIDMYKMVGRFAVQQGQRSASKRLAETQDQVDSLLAEFGLRSDGGAPAEGDDRAADPPEGAVAATDAATDVATGSPGEAEVVELPASPRSSAAADELPLADYDSLAASQVIPRLMGLSPAELEAVRAYEAAHRGRKTILGRLAQLQSA